MEKEMQKTSQNDGCLRNGRTESENYGEVQTYLEIIGERLAEVSIDDTDLLGRILSPDNLTKAYKQVVRNGGAGGIDKMETSELLPYLTTHKDELITMLRTGKYKPNPVRRVEIPKDNGKMRQLGIPTVVDRFVQQAISQVLIPIYENQFSDNSFGFRPNRGCHKALLRAQEHINNGYHYCVDLDLEKFFDTVNHSKLIEVISRTIKDGRVVSLIHKYLNAGVMVRHKYEDTREGVPQGGPLSPLLSNILLNELDKELERRCHPFVRYADDCIIFTKSLRATERVRDSIASFVENKLFLKVNMDKTHNDYVKGMKFLGYTFDI